VSFPSSSDSASRAEVFRRIKAVAMDVDGVLTDGSFYWGPDGVELKRFCMSDSTGMAQARDAGIRLALISGESSGPGMALVRRYAEKLRIETCYPGCHDKAAAFREFAEKHGVDLADACFVGDDVIDLEAMSLAGLAVAPADAHPLALARAGYVTKARGGNGAVRELFDLILGRIGPEAGS
jgi:3-deoxy-D-manno-octulosonate 8-phosphate phosphatase (KDO 8-P phosphatase)